MDKPFSQSDSNKLYDHPKIEPNLGEKLLLVSLNKSYRQSKAMGIYRRANDYECARKYWRIAAWKAAKIDYILGIYKGIVRIVIKVNAHDITSIGEHGEIYDPPRHIFQGDIIEDSPYMNADVSDYPFGRGGAVTYIPRNNKEW